MYRSRTLSTTIRNMTLRIKANAPSFQNNMMPPQRRYVMSPRAAAAGAHRIKQMSTNTTTPTAAPTQAVFKTWPNPMIESRGDYREEAHLEDLIGGQLYSAQKSLPSLPIPTVEETLSTFLPTALPLAESEEEANALVEACKVFPDQAAKLHQRLLDRKSEMSNSSWLQLWWNTWGYLQVRDPTVVNVSYFFHFSDDGTLPSDNIDDEWSFGVSRAASMLSSAAEFRKMVCTGALPHEQIGRKDPKTPLCMVALKYMFNSCRVPHREQDTYRLYDPSLHKHCVVACKGNFYAIDFVDDAGDALPLEVIEARLRECVELAEKQSGPNLGWLTSSDRDSWADARQELLRVGDSKMNRALEKLESGALMICLDDEEPTSKKQCGELFWTGGLTSGNNRWFDKSIQIMCTKNGKAGLCGEHAMMDGMPMIGFANHLTKNRYCDSKSKSKSVSTPATGGVENIFEGCSQEICSTDSKVEEMVTKAKGDFTTLITDHSLDVQSFQGYGSSWIKKAGYSPDAFAQMAIQLAIFRLHGKQAATYEATQMRPYLHGRTETTRTVSTESAAFVQCMGVRPQYNESDEDVRKEKINLLRKAVDAHVSYIRKAGNGQGVDRHLLGMSLLADDETGTPTLYSDPLYARSKSWRVSTSHLTHPKFENWGFGEVVPDGVGIGYAVKSDSVVFNITARREHDWTERLSHLLEEALLEMQILNDMDKKMQSKL